MSLRGWIWPRGWWRKLIVITIALIGLYAILGFLILPAVLPGQIEAAVKSALGREATVGSMRINPFLMSVGVEEFALEDGEDGPMISVGELFVDLNLITSATRRAVVLDAARIAGLRIDAVVDANGDLNLAALVPPAEEDEATEPETDEGGGLPPITVQQLDLIDVRATFRDEAVAEPFEFEIGPLELRLVDFSTRPDRQSSYSISATAPTGEELDWNGTLTIDPLQSAGTLELDNLSLVRFWRYVRGDLPLDLSVGDADLAASYSLQQVDDTLHFAIDDGRLAIQDLGFLERGGEAKLASLTHIDVGSVAVDLENQSVRIGRVALEGGSIDAVVDEEGDLNFLRLLPAGEKSEASADAASIEAEADGAAASESPWIVRLDEFSLGEFAVSLADRSVQPPLDLALAPIDITVANFTTATGESFAIDANLAVGDDGRIGADLTTVLDPLSVDGTIEMSGLPLPAIAGYVRNYAQLTIPSGTAGASGTFAVATAEDGTTTVRYTGQADIQQLALRLLEAEEDLLRWQRLGLQDIALDTGEGRLVIGMVEIADPFAQVEIDEEGRLTIDRIQVVAEEPEAVAAPAAQEEGADAGFAVTIEQIRLDGGTVQFVDRTMRPPFRTSLNEMKLSVGGIELADLGGIDLDLQAKIDADAPLVIKGKLSPPGHRQPADVALSLTGYDLTAVSPYVGRYIGYEVSQGKLTLKLDYELEQNRLKGANDIVAQRFSLGDSVDSPDALDVPVKLALAVLRDSSGKISLDLPVSGNLDDPQFSLTSTIAGTFTNILQKAVTSPFSILGSIVGIGADELSHVEFEPGRADLAENETKKIEALAEALSKRPGLQLEIRGAADQISDAPALARDLLAQRLLQEWLEDQGLDAAALGDRDLEIPEEARRDLLFEEYEEVFGREIAKPEEESLEERAARAEAAILHRIEVDEEELAQLGKRRSRVIRDALEARGVPRAQLFRVKAKVTARGRTPVPIELTVSPAG